MTPAEHFGNYTRSGVSKVYGKKYYEFPSITWIYFWIDKQRDDLSVDSSSTVTANKGGKK
jgi:hypothetical protein